MFFACAIWCEVDISSVSPSRLLQRRANGRNVSYTPYPTGEKHTISTFVDQTRIQLTRQSRKKSFFSKLVFHDLFSSNVIFSPQYRCALKC